MLPRGRAPPRRLEPHRPEACDPLLEGWVCREEPHQDIAAERIHDEEVRGRRVGRHRRDLVGTLELLEGAGETASWTSIAASGARTAIRISPSGLPPRSSSSLARPPPNMAAHCAMWA